MNIEFETTHYFISSDQKYAIHVNANSNQAKLYGHEQCHLADLASAIVQIRKIVDKPIKCYVLFGSNKNAFYVFSIKGKTIGEILQEIIEQVFLMLITINRYSNNI